MTTVNYQTGEIVEALNATQARRLTTEAQNEFKSAVDHSQRGWSLIEEVVSRGGWQSLDYRSPGDYVAAEFDGALAGLNVTQRRLAVREATGLGYSTRAIAPVVGANQATVVRDRAGDAPASPQTPESAHGGEAVTDSGQTPEPSSRGSEAGGPSPEVQPDRVEPPAPRPAVTGIDGKTYTRPEPSPRLAAELAERDAERQIDMGRKSTTLRIAECVHFLRNDPEAFVEHFLPHEERFVADGLRLSRERIDEAIHFLTTIREAVQR